MSQYNTVLVPLGLTDNDENLIRYTGFFAKNVGVKKIYFIHVNKSLKIPESVLEDHPDLLPPLDESLEKDMQREVEKNFGDYLQNIECTYQALEGHILSEILNYAHIKDVDLILTGASTHVERTSILSTRLAHKSPCSVLSVPYDIKSELNMIGCPIDFSEHSDKAFRVALKLSETTGSKITCLHAYEVPIGYAKAGRTYDEFAEIMRSHAEKSFQELLEKFNCDPSKVSCEFILSRHPAKTVREFLTQGTIDLLVIGSRGHGAAATLVLGSVTEELLLTTQLPIISVKEKGENKGFLKALFNKKAQYVV